MPGGNTGMRMRVHVGMQWRAFSSLFILDVAT